MRGRIGTSALSAPLLCLKPAKCKYSATLFKQLGLWQNAKHFHGFFVSLSVNSQKVQFQKVKNVFRHFLLLFKTFYNSCPHFDL